VGGLGIIVDLGVFTLLYWGYFINLGQSTGTLIAQTISFSAAVTSNFVFNRIWTFKDKSKETIRITKQYLLFFAVAVSAWVIRTLIIYFLINFEDTWRFYSMPVATWLISILSIEQFALLVAIVIVTFWNFIGSKYFVFSREKTVIKS
jgi:dolichol-phosphate mannosyltransferase